MSETKGWGNVRVGGVFCISSTVSWNIKYICKGSERNITVST